MGTASSGATPRLPYPGSSPERERQRRTNIGLSKLYGSAYKRFKETVTKGVLFPVLDSEGQIVGGLPCKPEQVLEAARLIVEYHDGKPIQMLQTGSVDGLWGLLALVGTAQPPTTPIPELPAESMVPPPVPDSS